MKTRKELLKFFLEKLGLWNQFEQELNSHETLRPWEKIDDALWLASSFEDADVVANKSIRVANRLSDKEYLNQLMLNEDVGSFTFAFAIADLCVYAGLDSEDSQVWKTIPEQASIMCIVDKVYSVACNRMY